MKTKEVMKTKVPSDEEKPMELATCMAGIIDELEDGKKYPAARIYRSTLNSFAAFADEERMLTPFKGCTLLLNVFTPGRLKTYQEWLRQRKSKWNTVSTYMRTLRAVYNRIYAPGSAEHNPKLFDDVYTKVESKTKRALEEEEMAALIEVGLRLPHKTARKMVVDVSVLSRESQCNLGYFVLMFFFHGMPFIDIAYLRKQDLQGDVITYCRHKTGVQLTVRIPEEARELFETFRDKDPHSTWLFPILDGEETDDRRLYESYLKALRRFNKQLGTVAALLLPGVRLSSYTPRHTWATLAFYRGMLVGLISKALGHSSVKVTETYLKPFEDAKVDAANMELILSIRKKRRDYKQVTRAFVSRKLLTK